MAAESKLLSEEDAVRQAEDRLRVLHQEAAGRVEESPPATVPANFAQELAQLRDFVSELQRERDELRKEFAGRSQGSQEDARPRKTNKSLSTPSLDLVIRQARYGLRGERVGEASHPGPSCELVSPTRVDSETGIEHLADVPMPEIHVLSQAVQDPSQSVELDHQTASVRP